MGHFIVVSDGTYTVDVVGDAHPNMLSLMGYRRFVVVFCLQGGATSNPLRYDYGRNVDH